MKNDAGCRTSQCLVVTKMLGKFCKTLLLITLRVPKSQRLATELHFNILSNSLSWYQDRWCLPKMKLLMLTRQLLLSCCQLSNNFLRSRCPLFYQSPRSSCQLFKSLRRHCQLSNNFLRSRCPLFYLSLRSSCQLAQQSLVRSCQLTIQSLKSSHQLSN